MNTNRGGLSHARTMGFINMVSALGFIGACNGENNGLIGKWLMGPLKMSAFWI